MSHKGHQAITYAKPVYINIGVLDVSDICINFYDIDIGWKWPI